MPSCCCATSIHLKSLESHNCWNWMRWWYPLGRLHQAGRLLSASMPISQAHTISEEDNVKYPHLYLSGPNHTSITNHASCSFDFSIFGCDVVRSPQFPSWPTEAARSCCTYRRPSWSCRSSRSTRWTGRPLLDHLDFFSISTSISDKTDTKSGSVSYHVG